MRRLFAPLLLLLALVAAALSALPVAYAGGQRTFVASYGAPTNVAFNCSITKPCRAFSEAIGVTNPKGEVLVLDSAGYGPVTITKSVSIIAPPGIYAGVTAFSGDGITINASGATVVLRGLSVNGQGGLIGIHALQAARVRVENCVISNMASNGIYHQANNAEMVVLDTIVRDNGDGGLALVALDASIVMDHVRSEHNVNDGFYIAPTPGSATVGATIVDSVFSYNGGNGIWVDTVSSAFTRTQVERSVMSNNGGRGFRATSGVGGAFVTLGRNAIGDNGLGAIDIYAPTGYVRASISENIIQHNDRGIGVYGASSEVYVNANTVDVLGCGPDSATNLLSYGNNAAQLYTGGCYVKIGGL